MRVKNVSARLHHVGNVSIAPLEIKEIDDMYAASIDKAELVEVVEPAEPVKRGRKMKIGVTEEETND